MSELYDEMFRKLELRTGEKIDLASMMEYDQLLGSPSRAFQTVHVAGTNGKGSVCTKIAHGLMKAGKKVGLFTSPHIDTCRERIQINQEMISEEEFVEIFKIVTAVSEKAMFFDILTLMAFVYFRKHKVDMAVFEVGMGGAFDSTNIIIPELSVITNVSMDHMKHLGDTLELIATNKAGIIKSGIPVVLGDRAALPCVIQRAVACRSPIYFVRSHPDWMEENTLIAKRALSYLLPSETFTDLSIVQSCRFERVVREGLTIIFDVAHNIDGFIHLFKRVNSQFPGQKLSVIVGMSRDKNHAPCVELIKSQTDAIYPVTASHKRLFTQGEIERVFKIVTGDTLEAFVERARRENRVLVVCGSFFIMKAMKEALRDPSLV